MSEHSKIPVLQEKRILLGITGSIAAFKASDLASKLAQAGAEVDTVLTQAGTEFITPLNFQSLTGRRAYVDRDLREAEGHIVHIQLAKEADLCVIAPATANTIAKLGVGLADNLLSLLALALESPLMIAPAMDVGMYEHPATQANISLLQERGVIVVGPEIGRVASGREGLGRMTEPDDLLGHIRLILGRNGSLAGKNVVVTAGGTSEPIDPVRSITNRSSGKQGFALAQAALDRGAQVTLIAGTSDLPTPIGADRVNAPTAAQMCQATLDAVQQAQVLIMAAAVADFRPVTTADDKIKRKGGVPDLPLEPTEDILQAVVKQRQATGFPEILVGFAAESQDLEANAKSKMREKGLDLIVANDISASDAGFAVDHNRVLLLDAEAGVETFPLMLKSQVAERVLDRVETHL